MIILISYNLLIYLLLRCVGFGIAVDFYITTKESRFKLAVLGWGFWVIASISSVASGLIDDNNIIELLLFLNAFFVSLGTIFYIWLIFTYFLEIPNKIFYFLLAFLIILLLITYIFINYKLALNLAVFSVSIILLSVYIVPLLNWKKFKERMGLALKWYYIFLISLAIYIVISIYISSQNLGYYGVYSSYDIFLLILNYFTSILFYIMLIILLIHVEYNFSHNQRFELKDKYSHDLGNILQFITGYIDIISQEDNFQKKDLSELKNIFNAKCKEASDILREIRQL
ncbi:MAG: hypothetical protein ACFE9Z_12710 [Promethearchaeota archaeon]